MIDGPWDDGSPLSAEVHGELIRDAQRYARLAGIRQHWIWQPLSAHAGTNEVSWVSGYHRLGERGLKGILYTGPAAGLGDRMQAMAGALIRNFVDARIRPTQQAITRIGPIEEAPDAECSVLFLPDLCVGAGQQPDWFVREVTALLMERERAGRQTVCYARSLDMLKQVYGETLAEMLGDSKAYLHMEFAS